MLWFFIGLVCGASSGMFWGLFYASAKLRRELIEESAQ